ncbi:MAG TPA: type I phosphomannose isomerase catalytic subunit [Opitutaceae bacterium]|nr:type I phosphomannose isomerase catalytic subunit [Opitutaceae bacterium]
MEALRFEPIYQERVWGGQAMAQAFDRSLPAGCRVGESWEVVDRLEAQSVVRGGRHAGRTLRELIAGSTAELMGPRWDPARPFPLLVKWLDCRERLSLQVHPPAEKAAALGGEPKTENWFIAGAAPGAAVIVGLRAGVTRAAFEQAAADGTIEQCVNRLPLVPGDSILVRSGTVHAIDAGNLILEIQQNSDTTYRVHDWGRVGLDGKPRQLHWREALESIRWDAPEPRPVRAGPGTAVLVDCPEFRVRRIPVSPGQQLEFAAGQKARLLHVVRGAGEETTTKEPWRRGENLLLPFGGRFAFRAHEDSLLLVTENFA